MKKNLLFTILTTLFLSGILYFSYENFTQNNQKEKESEADHPEMFTKYMHDITTRMGEQKTGYSMNYQVEEFSKATQQLKNGFAKTQALNWKLRGPANVGGRTRAILIDPDDTTHNTWFAAGVTGGIWKTTDNGDNYVHLTDNFPNLSVCALAMATSNHNVIYAGTGESFPGGTYQKGNGIWKSTDKGTTWIQLLATANDENFAYTNRIVVSPTDENIVLAATETGIMKSLDGGISWTKKYNSQGGIEDLDADPTDFNTLYACEHNMGVVRSTDMGEAWAVSSTGIAGGARFELAVSPVDNNNVFLSANISDTESHIYFSSDKGMNWVRFDDTQNFLGGQGNYDNTVAAHPYVADEVFVGGVDIWKVKLNGDVFESAPKIRNAYTVNADFISFINFGGEYLNGGMSIKDGTDLVNGDTVSVEIRFGKGLTQKAHRFTVPENATSGVAPNNYTYQDYVDVPFQVWDVTNNRQLMVSFRDQENDGKFNLYPRTGDAYGLMGREYIFVNSVAYDAANPSSQITKNGGHLYKSLYMFWMVLSNGYTWDENNLPDAKIVVDYGTIMQQKGVKTSIADSYGNYGGPNSYDQSAGRGTTSIPGIHPDHHSINIIPLGNGNFKWVDGNDGGIAISEDNGVTLTQKPTNYITTQFYGVAKNPDANEYIGGMQDNGTWQSSTGDEANDKSAYKFRIGGDGFECLWNAKKSNLLLGSIYNNQIYRSSNNGVTWNNVNGITANDGPFISHLSASKEEPDVVFAVGKLGVYKSTDFGKTWKYKYITNGWSPDSTVASSHNVEVSLANGHIVWAGAGMAKDYGYQLQVSINKGERFTAVEDYSIVTMDAFLSGIATHPTQDSTAYALFSLAHYPKVLRTTDLGKTWEDISGFGTGTSSTNGFPDVVIHSLLVMPYNPNIIWVGTDIGLFESTDNGESWHIADNGLPAVSVYDMLISGDQVVVATHGRGIWTLDIPEINNVPQVNTFAQKKDYDLVVTASYFTNFDSIQLFVDNEIYTTLATPAIGEDSIDVAVSAGGTHTAKILGFKNDSSYWSNRVEINNVTNGIAVKQPVTKVKVYPNPATDYIQFEMKQYYKNLDIRMIDLGGKLVYSTKKLNTGTNTVKFNLKKGIYILQIESEGKLFSQKLSVK